MNPIRRLFLLVLGCVAPVHAACADDRPNVLIMMVDDLGFSDIGCYGGEIETPHLDSLAAGGIRFSQFYNTAKCHSSRVSLLTGQYCIAAGDTALSHGVTSAEVLHAAGYHTAMTGKWHLKQEPTDFGFQRYFGHLSGACNYFRGDGTFRLNGEPWSVPSSDFYTTVANVDYGLQFLREADQTEQPWYLYIAFNAPHAPLQALPQDFAKYEGRYDAGWDVMRASRLAKQQRLGLLPATTVPSERPDHVPAWDELSEPRQEFECKRMTALAGMIDRVDQEVGRVLSYLRETGQLDNTLIWFVSDNGACPYDRNSNKIESMPTQGDVSWSDSTGWAWARNSPFRYYKQNQFEGGIATPAIIHWPAGMTTTPGSICRQPGHLIDVMPTVADVTSAPIPETFTGRELRPVSGVSLKPVFSGQKAERGEALHFLFASDRAVRDGDWKAVSFRSGPWELYDLATDRTERHDLAAQHPQRLQRLVRLWTRMAEDVLHTSERLRAPVRSESSIHQHLEWTNFDADPASGVRGNRKQASSKARPGRPKTTARARKNTTMKLTKSGVELTFTGDDPGLAFDRLASAFPAGKLTLSFDLKSSAAGSGEVFFTTDASRSLPRGTRVPFDVVHDDQWHAYQVTLDASKPVDKLRLDVSEGRGTAVLADVRVSNGDGVVIWRWPAED
ncbi:MAG: arylsulfatase [Planctomycetota bacterium]